MNSSITQKDEEARMSDASGSSEGSGVERRVSGAELMRHALGVRKHYGGRWKKPYRNHFCAGDDDVPAWDALVAEGLATKTPGNAITGGAPLYRVTDAGRAVALAGLTIKRLWCYGEPEHP